ncbi:hypothetical protein [Alicyclobacillus cycloheptanicus]|uniref:Uncharacterized protein n=1 Tax=Alicyclobacillus cycloheptanicus TaxID=1457 RepID=A0ABT9XD61_9BACL|nr:hypothetical protein [Alicyclobacillus cycloheptanicus]MDQ0188227.1 hypothetical protein [Alicyclobacillus cycloheptanicus]
MTTEEFILQRSQRTYRIALDNILGLMECPEDEFRLHGGFDQERAQACGRPYKIVTTLLYLVSPAGVIEQSRVSLYARLSAAFADQMTALLRASS